MLLDSSVSRNHSPLSENNQPQPLISNNNDEGDFDIGEFEGVVIICTEAGNSNLSSDESDSEKPPPLGDCMECHNEEEGQDWDSALEPTLDKNTPSLHPTV